MKLADMFKNYSLSIVLFVLFMASWVGQFFAQMSEAASQAAQHGQAFAWSDFWPAFLQSTLENWQSEFLQLFTFVVLTTYLIHKGSHESKDSDEQMQASLDRIEKRLQALKPAKK